MKNTPIIDVLEGCDFGVAQAIDDFQHRWLPYSASSRRHPIIALMKELIDPAVNRYCRRLSRRQWSFVAGVSGGASFSAVAELIGLDALVRTQQCLLRCFMHVHDVERARGDSCFIATIESLIRLVECCSCKQPPELTTRGTGLRGADRKGTCRFCGALGQQAACAQNDPDFLANNEKDELEPSAWYCSAHRPKLANGAWNPLYRQAMRSQDQFALELRRLSLQCAHPAMPHARTGNQLVENYIWRYVSGKTLLQPSDRSELRDHARLMVDSKLSDRKKQILALLGCGLNQSAIAQKLGIKRQSVSKALRTIPAGFRLDSVPRKLYVVRTSEAQVSA